MLVVLGGALFVVAGPSEGDHRGVLLIGDSITVMAGGSEFERAGWTFNAYPGRTTPQGTELAQNLNASTREVVIVALGTNDYRDTADAYSVKIDKMMDVIGPGPRVIWVNVDATTNQLASAGPGVNTALAAATDRYPNLRVADWNTYVQTVEGTPGLRSGDGIHYDLKGSELRRAWTLALVTP